MRASVLLRGCVVLACLGPAPAASGLSRDALVQRAAVLSRCGDVDLERKAGVWQLVSFELLGDAGDPWGSLRDTGVESLVVDGVRDDALRQIAELPHLRSFGAELSASQLPLLAGMGHIRSLTLTVRSVASGSSSQDAAGQEPPSDARQQAPIAALADLKRIESLTLFLHGMTDGDAEGLAALSRVPRLEVHFDNVSEAGLRHLAGLPGLRGLGLPCLTPPTAGQLVRLQQLETLCLWHAGASDLTPLADLPQLASLVVKDGYASRKHFAAISRIPMLRRLVLGGFIGGDPGPVDLTPLAAARNLRILVASGWSLERGEFAARFPNLEGLGMEAGMADWSRALGAFPGLRELTAFYPVLIDEDLVPVAKMPSLRTLRLYGGGCGVRVSRKGLALLAKVTSLENLQIREGEGDELLAPALASLGGPSGLKDLDLAKTEWDLDGLGAAVPSLERLTVTMSKGGLAAIEIGRMQKLRELAIELTDGLSDRDIAELSKASRLESLILMMPEASAEEVASCMQRILDAAPMLKHVGLRTQWGEWWEDGISELLGEPRIPVVPGLRHWREYD